MLRTLKRGTIAVALAMIVAGTAAADTITYTSELDGVSDYGNIATLNDSGLTGESLTVDAPENRTSGVEFVTDLDGTAGFARYSVESAAVFDPAGVYDVTSVDWSVDIASDGDEDSTTILYPAVFQGGESYVYTTGGLSGGNSNGFRPTDTTFETIGVTGLDASDFGLYDTDSTPDGFTIDFADEVDGASNPDFSATGGAITFGYVAVSGTSTSTYTREAVVDDSEITVAYVPEPGTLALVGFGALAAGLRRRRRA